MGLGLTKSTVSLLILINSIIFVLPAIATPAMGDEYDGRRLRDFRISARAGRRTADCTLAVG